MDSQTFAGPPVIGIFCSGLNAYCMQTRPLFLRISGSSGVLKAFFFCLKGINNYPVTKKKKKKKKWPTGERLVIISYLFFSFFFISYLHNLNYV